MSIKNSSDAITAAAHQKVIPDNIVGINDRAVKKVFEDINAVKKHVESIIKNMGDAGIIDPDYIGQLTNYFNKSKTVAKDIAKLYKNK